MTLRPHLRRASLLPLLAVLALAGSVASCSSPSTPATVAPSATPTRANTATTGPILLSSSVPDGIALTRPRSWSVDVDGGVVDHVDFLIDDRLRWTEYNVPYEFNDDGGLLVPWLLRPGKHVLTALAKSADGTASQTVATVRVAAPPAVPAGLTGTFVREVKQADIDRTASNPGREAELVLPAGRWTMHLANGLLSFVDPNGGRGAEAFSATMGELTIWGPPNWLLPKDRQGGFCHAEPPGFFRWSRKGDQLVITGGGNCADRDALFNGIWRRRRP